MVTIVMGCDRMILQMCVCACAVVHARSAVIVRML